MRHTTIEKEARSRDPRLAEADHWSCAQCGRVVSVADLIVVEVVDDDTPIAQDSVDEWLVLAGGKPGSIRNVGIRRIHTLGLCSTCASLLPREGSD